MMNEKHKLQAIMSYFLVSLIISSMYFIEIQTMNVVYLVRIIANVVTLFFMRRRKYISVLLLLNKLILFFCGIWSEQNESILQYTLDGYLIDKLFSFQELLAYQLLQMSGVILLTYIKYQDDILVMSTMCIPFLLVCPQILYLYFNFKLHQNKDSDNRLSDINQQIERDYVQIRSPRDQEVGCYSQEGIPSCDINKLIINISNHNDQQYITRQIQHYQESLWKVRMNAMPIGIAIVDDNFQVRFLNRTLVNILKKHFSIGGEQNYELLDEIFMQSLFFKRIDICQFSFGNDWPPSARTKYDRNRTIRNQSEEDLINLRCILENLADGQLCNFINSQDSTLELFGSFQTSLRRQIYLDCKILYNENKNMDYLITIQDFTKQYELSRLEEQNQFKTKVIQSFSHELRTPLNSAILFLKSSLQEDSIDVKQKNEYLKPCLSVLNLQNHIINDIIDFSQINAKLLELKFSTFELQQLIDDLTQQFKYQFECKKIGLAFEVDSSVHMNVKTDYQRLLQVLTNIIQNSLKFSEKGYILIKVTSQQQHELMFSIQDEGAGLSKIELKQLQQIINQEQLYQMTSEWKGFGLIICQMLLRYLSPMYNSNLHIFSDGTDRGTNVQFSVTNHLYCQTNEQITQYPRKLTRQSSMPILKAAYGLIINIQARSPSRIILNKTSQEDCELSGFSSGQEDFQKDLAQYQQKINTIEKLNSKILSSSFSNPLMPTRFTLNNICNCNMVLSVDDEVFNQKSLQIRLNQLGIDVDIVYNGRQALEKVMNPKKCSQQCSGYKLILMDCQMPIMDGWQTTIKLKEMMDQKKIPNIPIIGLTAFTSNEDIQRCLECGMNDVLHKPFEVNKFQQIIQKLRII